LAELQQLSAKLLAIADAGDAVQLVNPQIDQLLQPVAFILLPLTVGARISQQLF
jgi:hypothetical protein